MIYDYEVYKLCQSLDFKQCFENDGGSEVLGGWEHKPPSWAQSPERSPEM